MVNKEALRMEGITKVYPNGVVANKDVTFSVNTGEIHALSGENGAGKSTLMKILFGEERATRGTIYINGKAVEIASPHTAIQMGIGMVHQHFMLVESLSSMDNMILGIEPTVCGLVIDRKKAEQQVLNISQKYNLPIEPKQKVRDLTVGQKQKLEILKALIRGAKILILDEPTAVLTPQETRELFVQLRSLKNDGYTIIFISHKLGEVRELCDRITIMRQGRMVGVYPLSKLSEEQISHMMVGRDVVLNFEKKAPQPGETVLRVKNLSMMNDEGRKVLKGISFVAKRGEILGLAGVEGNGQAELVEALTGMCQYEGGEIEIFNQSIKNSSIRQLRLRKLSYIPEDRMTIGLAPTLSITDNMLADKVNLPDFSKGGLLRLKAIREYGRQMIKSYGVLAQSSDVEITSLSGGNIQKVVLARELSSDPEIIIADQPTRGVDVGASEFIRRRLVAMRDAGKTVFLISSDLNELFCLSDRLLVMFEGEIAAYFPQLSELTEDNLGRYMLGIDKQTKEQVDEAANE